MGLQRCSTKNIKLVAYLRLKAIYPQKVEKISRGKAEYHFEMDQQTWEAHKLEFDKSECLKYAQCLDAVVDLAH